MDKEMQKHIAEVSASFKRGTAEMLLLALLTKGEQYAYELSKKLKETSKGLFDIQGPSLYTILYRMQERGFVETRDMAVGRRIRVYYRMLPAGQAYLEQVLKEYLSVREGIDSVLAATLNEKNEDA